MTRKADTITDPDDVRLIEAEFLRQLWFAAKMRLARMAGQLPVPPFDPFAERLVRKYLDPRDRAEKVARR